MMTILNNVPLKLHIVDKDLNHQLTFASYELLSVEYC